MESASELEQYTSKALDSITKGFSVENFIGKTQYGEVFRGEIQQGLETKGVIVKIWSNSVKFETGTARQLLRFENEIKLLTESDVKRHPNLVKLIGCCNENGRLGVVYDLHPINTLRNLILQDDFKWIYRIKVAFGFACLLDDLHDRGLLLHNIDAAHLMVDQAFNPRLFDFSMLFGEVVGGVSSHYRGEWGCEGYFDDYTCLTGNWSDKTDVFGYGVVLLGLIAKRVDNLNDPKFYKTFMYVYIWAWGEYRKKTKSKFWPFQKTQNTEKDSRLWGIYKERKSKSLVHESLESDPSFEARDGVEITKLAMRCVERYGTRRPTMKEVVCCLKKLKVVQRTVLDRE